MGKIQLFYNKNCLLLLIFITSTLENIEVIAPINTLNNNIENFNSSPRIAESEKYLILTFNWEQI